MKKYGTKNKIVIFALLAVLFISLGVLARQNIREGMLTKKQDELDKLKEVLSNTPNPGKGIMNAFTALATNINRK
jgi:hypothetical protein